MCKTRTATLEAELFELKNKYKNFLPTKENVPENNKKIDESPPIKEPVKEEKEKFVFEFRVKMETLKAISQKLESDLAKYNCILEVELDSINGEGKLTPKNNKRK